MGLNVLLGEGDDLPVPLHRKIGLDRAQSDNLLGIADLEARGLDADLRRRGAVPGLETIEQHLAHQDLAVGMQHVDVGLVVGL